MNNEENFSSQKITLMTIQQAVIGVQIQNDPILLWETYDGVLPHEYIIARKEVEENYREFEQLVWKEIDKTTHVKECFKYLIRNRLKQKGILNSPMMSLIFDSEKTVENRLKSIKDIPGVDDLCKEYRGSSDPEKALVTDENARDLLAEILTLDFLIKSGFQNIHKHARKDKPHIDITAEKNGNHYSIDVTRKKEIRDWRTLDFSRLEDCYNPENIKKICRRLRQVLDAKDEQFSKALLSGSIDIKSYKIIAFKTSDYGFDECIMQATIIAQCLLEADTRWSNIDGIWLLPNVDVKESVWIWKEEPNNTSSK